MGVPHVRVILNPTAGAGAAARRQEKIEAAFRSHGVPFDIRRTERPGHAGELTKQAHMEGIGVVALVGGDGTLNEVMQAFIDDKGNPVAGPHLAMIPSGTGGDFKRTLGLSGSLEEAVARLAENKPRAIDFGVVRLTASEGGSSIYRAFANIASAGIAGETVSVVNATPKWLGGKLSFYLGTIRAIASYTNAPLRVKIDGKVVYEAPLFGVSVANGRFFGGGMMMAPHAALDDGQFEVIIVGDLPKSRLAASLTKIYRGAHIGEPGVLRFQGKRVELEPLFEWQRVLLELDGEQPGKAPAVVDIIPRGVTFRN